MLRGEAGPFSSRLHPDDWYEDNGIELATESESAIKLDPARRRLTLASGDTVPFETAVLATGAAPRRLRVPGSELSGVHYLRTVDDAVRLRDAIRGAERVAVVGAGWIAAKRRRRPARWARRSS